jgi:hypothetical protein
MATLVIDRAALPEPVSSCFAAPRIAVIQQQDGDVTLSPIIDPDDYDNDTDYLNAIPGMMESINEGIDAPDSECVDITEVWPDADNGKRPSLNDLVGKIKFRNDYDYKSMRAGR